MINSLVKYVNLDTSKLKMKRDTRGADHFEHVTYMYPPSWLMRLKRSPRLGFERRHFAKGEVVRSGFRPLACDVIQEKDVAIEMRDGVTLYADIFRPAETTDLPVILAWTPYGKTNPPLDYDVFPNRANIPKNTTCGLDTFEGPDPDYWVQNGFAVAVVDSRGSTHSEGDFRAMGHEEAKDISDAITWLGTQTWSNGKVGMTGNSWLAISQYFAAAEQPEHLAAIAPWEGFSDLYRDHLCWGGIPSTQFANKLGMYFRLRPGAAAEDFTTMLNDHPSPNDYWDKEKRPAFDQIKVPMYAVASWSSNIHPYGTFRAWKLAGSRDKWLRVHNTQEWPDLHTPKYRDELRAFFDFYLKGIDNGWPNTPRVRVSLLDTAGPDLIDVPIADFPAPNTEYKRLYLDGTQHSLAENPPERTGLALYDTQSLGATEFRYIATADMDLCGYITARLHVSTDAGNDLDLFMYVFKEDSLGVAHPPQILGRDFMGAESRLRVSRRRVSDRTLWDYKYDGTNPQPVKPGEVVTIDVVFWPIGMTWRTGEILVLSVGSTNLRRIEFPAPPLPTINQGHHTVHTGGASASYIDVPVVRRA